MYLTYKKIRDYRGLKDSDVSRITGINRSTFSDWKNGRSKPKDAKRIKIADCLNVAPEVLSEDIDNIIILNDGTITTADKLPAADIDIAGQLENVIRDLENQDGLFFSGMPLDDETRQLLKISISHSLAVAKSLSKSKPLADVTED